MYEKQFQSHSLRKEFLAGLPVAESQSAYLDEPSGPYQSKRVFGRDLIVMWYRVPSNLVIHTVPQSEWVFLIMPLNFEPSYTFNGRASERFDLYLFSGQNGYMSRGRDRNCIALGIRKPRLREMCSLLANGGIEDFMLGDFVLPSHRVIATGLHHAFVEAATQSAIPLSQRGQFAMSDIFERDLMCKIARMIVYTRHHRDANSLRLPAISLIRRAFACTDAVPAPTLAELCAATGVSQRWLNKCFIDVIGMPPGRFLKLIRLSRAREALLRTDEDALLIKSLWLSLGYTASGRFAADYRSVFGENPSDTMQNKFRRKRAA